MEQQELTPAFAFWWCSPLPVEQGQMDCSDIISGPASRACRMQVWLASSDNSGRRTDGPRSGKDPFHWYKTDACVVPTVILHYYQKEAIQVPPPPFRLQTPSIIHISLRQTIKKCTCDNQLTEPSVQQR